MQIKITIIKQKLIPGGDLKVSKCKIKTKLSTEMDLLRSFKGNYCKYKIKINLPT
jgi:hypothetical protein